MNSWNALDAAIVAVVLWCAVAGILRGFVRQAVGIAGLVAGHLVGIRFSAWAQGVLGLRFPYAEAAAYLILLLAVYVLVRLLGLLIEGWIRKSKLSAADRFVGMLAGLAKGGLVAVLLVFLLVVFLPKDAKILRGSRLAPKAVAAGRYAAKAFPERIGAMFREKVEGAAASPRPPPARKDRGK